MSGKTIPSTPLDALPAAGVAVWLNDLSRDRLRTGDLEPLTHTRNAIGVTTNPTIFAGALAHGAQLREFAATGTSTEAAVATITTDDVRAAADVFAPLHNSTDGVDGRVSIEVDPRLARDTAATIEQAKALWAQVDRPSIFIEIPATVEGCPRSRPPWPPGSASASR